MDIRNQQILNVNDCDFFVVTAPSKPTTLYMFGRSRDEGLGAISLINAAAYNLRLNLSNNTFQCIDDTNADTVSVLGDLWNINPATDTLWMNFCSVQSMKLMNFQFPPEALNKTRQYANITHLQYSFNGGPNSITSPITITLNYDICLVLSLQHIVSTFITPNPKDTNNTKSDFPFLEVSRVDDESRIDVEIGHCTLKNNIGSPDTKGCAPFTNQNPPALDNGPPWARFNNFADYAAQIYYVSVGRIYYDEAVSDNALGKYQMETGI